jgi:hypothetical protein
VHNSMRVAGNKHGEELKALREFPLRLRPPKTSGPGGAYDAHELLEFDALTVCCKPIGWTRDVVYSLKTILLRIVTLLHQPY